MAGCVGDEAKGGARGGCRSKFKVRWPRIPRGRRPECIMFYRVSNSEAHAPCPEDRMVLCAEGGRLACPAGAKKIHKGGCNIFHP